jgi:hypothetical protein
MASKSPRHQCLFCKQVNPAGATFCNGCGVELHLQPCEVCGAIDSRNAKYCYKCGAPFSFSATPDKPSDEKAADDGNGAGEHPPLIESAAQVLSAMRQGPRAEGGQPMTDGGEAATTGASRPTDAPTGAPESPQRDAAPQSKPGSRGMWGVALAAVVLAAIAVVASSHLGQPAPAAPAPVATQSSPGVAGQSIAADAAPAVVAQADAVAAPGSTPKLAAGVSGFDEAVALARPGAAPAPPAPAPATIKSRPVAPTETRVRPRREAPILKECPQSVALLGLCSPAQ